MRQLKSSFNFLRLLATVAVCLLALAPLPVLAERYLTPAEAQKLCFPEADRFEQKLIRYTSEQIATIEKMSGIKVRNPVTKFWVALQDTNVLGVVVLDFVLGKHEFIDYAAAISLNGSVRQIEILEYRESHGGQIRGKKWREQFKGKSTQNPLKLHEDIYNISGATISCRHVTEGVRRLLAAYQVALRDLLPAAGRVPDAAPAAP